MPNTDGMSNKDVTLPPLVAAPITTPPGRAVTAELKTETAARVVETSEFRYELHEGDDGPEWWRCNRVYGERTMDHRSRVLGYGGLELHAALSALATAPPGGAGGAGAERAIEGRIAADQSHPFGVVVILDHTDQVPGARKKFTAGERVRVARIDG